VCADLTRLDLNTFTYCRDDGVNMTWIDHIICSKMLDDSVKDVCVHYDFICSDHKPLSVCFKNLVPKLCATDDSDTVPA